MTALVTVLTAPATDLVTALATDLVTALAASVATAAVPASGRRGPASAR